MLELKLLPTDGNPISLSVKTPTQPGVALELTPFFGEDRSLSGNLIGLDMVAPLQPGVILTLAPFFRGERGLSGSTSVEVSANGPIGGHRVVIQEGGSASYATNENPQHGMRVLGVTENAAESGGTISVVRSGKVSETSWNFDISKPVFLGVNGLLTQTSPVTPAKFSLIVGFPLSATELFVSLREPLMLEI